MTACAAASHCGAELLRPYFSREALIAELELQEKIRLTEIQGGTAERVLKRCGIRLMGGRYLSRLRRWVESNS